MNAFCVVDTYVGFAESKIPSACIWVDDDEEIVQALHDDMADGLLDESEEQVREVIDLGDNTLDNEGGGKTVSSKPSGSCPLPPFPTVVDRSWI